MRLRISIALAVFAVTSSSTAAFAETWTLIIQPAPYSQSPPPYSAWQAYQQFNDLQGCLGSRMSLHYDLWQSDRDLSMRALSGVCRSDTSGQIVTGDDGSGEDDW